MLHKSNNDGGEKFAALFQMAKWLLFVVSTLVSTIPIDVRRGGYTSGGMGCNRSASLIGKTCAVRVSDAR